MLLAHNVPASTGKSPTSEVLNNDLWERFISVKKHMVRFFLFLLDKLTTTDRHIYTRKETQRYGNSTYWSGTYDASIFLAIVAAVLFVLYLVLTLYSKKTICHAEYAN